MRNHRSLTAPLLAAWLAAAAVQGFAAEPPYPTRQIRLVVPFPPGGGNDAVARPLAARMEMALRQPVVIENRGGAGGTTGTDIVARARPDGYTLLINNISLAINATLFPKLPYDTQKSLQPVSLIGRQPNVLAVAPSIKAASAGEFLKFARARPEGIIYGSGGPGSSSHLAAVRLALLTGISMTHVPYQGLAQAMTGLGTGKVEMIIATISTAQPHMKTGKIRALAVTGPQRTPLLPSLPTMIEAGVVNYEVSTWYMLLAPAKTPRAVVGRLNDTVRAITAGSDVTRIFAAEGLDPLHSSSEQAAALLKSEIEKWGPVVKATGAKPQ